MRVIETQSKSSKRTRQTNIDNTDVVKIMQQKIDALENQLQRTNKSLEAFRRIFHADQIDFLTRAKVKWSKDTIAMCRAIKKLCGPNGYELLRSYGLPFPSVKILAKDLATLDEVKREPQTKCLLFTEFPTPKLNNKESISTVATASRTDNATIDIPQNEGFNKVQIALDVDDADDISAMSLSD